MASHPSPLPGNTTRTDSLSFIPTFDEKEKKSGKKNKDKKDEGPKKSGWGWLRGKDSKDEEKDDDEDSASKKARGKASKAVDKSHDNTRLDLLQTSIDGGRGRQSLVLDREELNLQEARRKESSRKSAGSDTKKEKDGLFSAIFGGKRKSDRDGSHKKGSSPRTSSPDPPHRILRPDIDYNWTRFSILEERAIYRMAHLKLANPRRALYSQVLLSNFMYSYLAKVQQMHPATNVLPNPAQKKGTQAERGTKNAEDERYQEEQQNQQQVTDGGQYHQRYQDV
jgi:hypothetical protein